jgi:hypothetical protein
MEDVVYISGKFLKVKKKKTTTTENFENYTSNVGHGKARVLKS